MSHTLTEILTLETEQCCVCGCVFAMPTSMKKQRLDDGKLFYCPSGHNQHYTDSLSKKLEEERQKVVNLNIRNAELAGKLERAETARASAVEKKKKIEIRVKNGVCPCCNRTFQNLGRHMQTKHRGDPSYKFRVDKLAAKVKKS